MSVSPVMLIVGRGSIGRKHEANALASGVKVVTVDPEPESQANYSDLETALRREGKGAFSHAIIATPPSMHLTALDVLLKYGCSMIMIEKPLCALDEIEWAKNLWQGLATNQKIFIGFNWRFNSAIRQLKQVMVSGKLGQVQVAQLYAREWLPKYGGNALLHSGSHIVDTASYLLGALRVHGAHLVCHDQFGLSDESVSVLLSNPQGADVYIHVNLVNKANYDYRILIQGSRATWECCPDRLEFMHVQEMRAFLTGKGDELATFEDGIANLKLLTDIIGTRREKIHAID